MKYLLNLFKAVGFSSAFLFANLIYSQATCGGGYNFTSSSTVTPCTYTFVPVLPIGHPCITNVTWTINSPGTYGSECDRRITDTLGLTYQFCFYGNHVIKMFIRFCDNSVCVVSQTINISCTGAVFCNPDPGNDSIPDPTVEITYIDPESNCGVLSSPKAGCMYESCGLNCYIVACGWHWAIRIPESEYNCDLFTFRLEYIDVDDCDDGTVTCVDLIPGTIYCIFAKLDEDIIIEAIGNSCCMPANYHRAFIWHPVPCGGGGLAGIRDPCPGWDFGNGDCNDRCTPAEEPCTEDVQQISQSTGIPSPSCLTGGKNKKHSALSGKKDIFGNFNIKDGGIYTLEENFDLNSYVSIMNIHGIEIYNGIWQFGSLKTPNWPNNMESGLYFVKFKNSSGNQLRKFFKPN